LHVNSPLDDVESKLVDAVNALDDLASEAESDGFRSKAGEARRVLAFVEEALGQVQRLRDGDPREGY